MLTLPALLVATAALAADPPVEYAIDLSDARSQIVRVEMTVRDAPGPTLEVALPVWRPGKYQVIDPAGTIRTLSARGEDGAALAVEKTAKSTWRVELPRPGDGHDVTIAYEVYANSLADRTRHVDSSHAFLSPSSVLLFRPGLEGRAGGPLRVTLKAPEEWEVATGLEPEGSDPRVLTAPSYDVLADSPIEIGDHERVTFDVDGAAHEIVLWSPAGEPGIPLDKWPEDFEKIVREQKSIFGSLPYQRYVFLVHNYPGGGGGTEHLNSTIMQTGPARLADREAFRGFLGLVSHEFFHTWNVKQFRPQGLKPYDYLRENYTRLLWVAEGTTSYYGPLTLVRAGITKPDDYLKSLGTSIDALRTRPGAGVQSLEDSSFDAWIKFNARWPDSANSTVSFYDKGALVSLALDMEVRKRSGGDRSLDDVMRTLFEKFPLAGDPYTTQDVLDVLRDAAGTGLEEFFAAHVAGVDPVDFESALAVVGLQLRRGGDKEKPDVPWLGVSVSDTGGLASVTGVSADGPAYAAGVVAGDTLLAIGGQRVTAAGLEALEKRLKVGESARVTLFRYDQLHEMEVPVQGKPAGKWTVTRTEDPSEGQKAAYKAWLTQEWPEKGTDVPKDEEKEGDK